MDDRGNIAKFDSAEAAEAAGFKTPVPEKHYAKLMEIPVHLRHSELELLNFMADESRRSLGETVRMKVENAFRMGYAAAERRNASRD